jgi:hypothetical protein
MNIKDVLQKWADSKQVELVKNYDRLGLRASGEFEKSLRNEIIETPKSIQLIIKGAQHSYWMQNGRQPNKNQNKEYTKRWVGWAGSTFLKKWVEDKRLSINPFAVAWKIAKKGIIVPNKFNSGGVISDSINKKSIGELIKEVGRIESSIVVSNILKEFRK